MKTLFLNNRASCNCEGVSPSRPAEGRRAHRSSGSPYRSCADAERGGRFRPAESVPLWCAGGPAT